MQAPPTLTGAAAHHKVTLAGTLGSSDNSGLSEAEPMQWNAQDWKFDPYAMRAMPVPRDGSKTLSGKQHAAGGGVDPPVSSGAPAAQQPAKLPQLAMPTGSRSKGHPTCQVCSSPEARLHGQRCSPDVSSVHYLSRPGKAFLRLRIQIQAVKGLPARFFPGPAGWLL